MTKPTLSLPFGPAICYSGYRAGQSPRDEIFPSFDQVKEDLRIVSQYWSYIRLYDISEHAERVLDVISQERLPLKVMIGNDLRAEHNNPDCPWGAQYREDQLASNIQYNNAGVEKLISMAHEYQDIVVAASIGNEASVEWTDHLVSVERLLSFAHRLKANIHQPITFCENYVPWANKLKPLVDTIDVISLHTYPVWEYKSIEEALDYTIENYNSVKNVYPDKPVIITEAGWCTKTNGRGMETHRASEALQTQYVKELMTWSEQNKILTFLFEAFDEPWKGSEDPLEPEKHWGLFYENRQPKPVIEHVFASKA